jgi:hypothetical protein
VADWREFRQCPGCGLDLGTGEGHRACAWGDCPYGPEELDVFCPQCRFDFLTMEGNPTCEDPMACENGIDARAHVANFKEWAGSRPG